METENPAIRYLTDMLNAYTKQVEFYQKKVDEIKKLIEKYEEK